MSRFGHAACSAPRSPVDENGPDQLAGTGLGVRWEGALIYSKLYAEESENTEFVPVLFSQDDTRHIPTPLQGATHVVMEGEPGLEVESGSNEIRLEDTHKRGFDETPHNPL